jgi:hypothetical protein
MPGNAWVNSPAPAKWQWVALRCQRGWAVFASAAVSFLYPSRWRGADPEYPTQMIVIDEKGEGSFWQRKE